MRVGVFVDITHQFKAAQTKHSKRINYEQYLTLAVGHGDLQCAFAYGAQVEGEAEAFIKRMRSFGYTLKYQRVPKDSNNRADFSAVDFALEMAIDILRIKERLDCVVLGANDPRFVPLVKHLQDYGIKVVVFSCEIPSELAAAASKAIELPDDILERKI